MPDFDTPEGRYAASLALGPDEYNRQMREHLKKSVIKTVNGYDLRPVSTRFGRLIQVDGTTKAFGKLEEAEKYANEQPPRE